MNIYRKIIEKPIDLTEMLWRFNNTEHPVGAMDTETTGLHIIKDTPFIFVCGWGTPDTMYIYAVDLEQHPELGRQVVSMWNLQCAPNLELYIGHHLAFDLHMLRNLGAHYGYYYENISDTQFYIRWGHDAIQQAHGGPPLALKDYAKRYVDRRAARGEEILHGHKVAMAKALNDALQKELHCTKKFLETFFKDKLNEIEGLPAHMREAYRRWKASLPKQIRHNITGIVDPDDIPYNLLPRKDVMEYALEDVVLTLRVFFLLDPIVKARENTYAISVENQLIQPFVEMERVGFRIDRKYFGASKQRLRNYILEKRLELVTLAGKQFKVGQHEVILKLLNERFNVPCTSTNKSELANTLYELEHAGNNADGVRFIKLVQELRSMEKWYSTYIIRFEKQLELSDHIYTQIHQVGTVSGRVTSDFQQFPKYGIRSDKGEELFYPRRMVLTESKEYNTTVYLDYSQIELRIQAIYTILCGNPDKNLLRAYSPYACVNKDGVLYDPFNPEHIATWNKEWYLEEDPSKPWTPTDLHSLTTKTAFDVDEDDEDFHDLRYKGKTANFAKNYGAQRTKIRQMFPTLTEEQVDRLNNAYYIAYPGIKTYQDYCYRIALANAYAANLFGVKFYNVSGHKLINQLIQGTGATLLKLKIREVYDYCKQNCIPILFQMNIHDELSFCVPKDIDLSVFKEIKRIMETWPDTLVPIVAEMEVTHTCWADKKKVA